MALFSLFDGNTARLQCRLPSSKKNDELMSDSEMIQYQLTEEYIELFKLLKICDLVESGGQAKFLISEGLVFVNDEQEAETRKRFKVRKGSLIHFDGQTIQVL